MYQADLRHPEARLQDKLEYLFKLDRDKSGDFDIRKPYLTLLDKLGNPHLSLPPVVHVAGTNGKGSVIAFLKTALEQSGYKIHRYTSPHIHKFNERIMLAGQVINDEKLETLIDEVIAANAGQSITFFEITTALAFLAFSREPADILLLEVGLGGRLDCTNVIESPLLSIITRLGLDHQEFLGDNIADIAFEKAGIIKEGGTCILGYQDRNVFDMRTEAALDAAARSKNATLCRADREWHVSPDTQGDKGFSFKFDGNSEHYPMPALPGNHQIENAGAAIAALHVLQDKIPTGLEIRQKAIKDTQWPGRLEDLSHILATELMPGWKIFFDGGHNEDAAHAISHWIEKQEKPVHVIFGMKGDKNPATFLPPILPLIMSISMTPLHGVKGCVTPDKIGDLLAHYDRPVLFWSDDIQNTIRKITEKHSAPGIILICGSLYLGEKIKENVNHG